MTDLTGDSLNQAGIRALQAISGYSDPLLTSLLNRMHEALNEGSLFVPCEDVPEDVLLQVKSGKWPKLIGAPKEYKPVIFDGLRFFFHKYYDKETKLLESLKQLATLSDRLAPDSAFESLSALKLDKGQLACINLALRRPFCVITGGPGTGKTITMVEIVALWIESGMPAESIALTAPTGRAAQRMKEALENHLAFQGPAMENIQIATIHRLLEYSPRKHEFRYQAQEPLPYSLVIVDEVSMVDVALMQSLLSAIDPAQSRLILIGDRDQLPSVEAGAVLASILSTQNAKLYAGSLGHLDKVFRSKANILLVANQINSGDAPKLNLRLIQKSTDYETSEDEVFLVEAKEERTLFSAFFSFWFARYIPICHQLNRAGTEAEILMLSLFLELEQSRILCIQKEGKRGVHYINHLFCHLAGPEFDPEYCLGTWFHGQPILILSNQIKREIYNGDVGIILRGQDGEYRVWFRRGQKLQWFWLMDMPQMQPGFSMTVHKSQGSEFENILVVLPQSDHRLLSREILYTALTRAKSRVFVAGDGSLVATAAKRSQNRQVR